MHTILNISRKGAAIGFVLLLWAAAAHAQIETEGEITTDSIDLFSEPQVEHRKSPTLAMIQSLLVPGLGHQYLGKPQRALTYFSTDLLLIFGAVFCESYSRHLNEDARTMAWVYAGARGGGGANENYWQNVGLYLDTDGYNRIQELNRTPENKYVEPHLQWAWVDEEYMDDYLETRDDATDFHIASTFLIGGMVLNRLVAFIDTRIATLRRKSTPRASRIDIDPQISAGLGTVGVTLSGTF